MPVFIITDTLKNELKKAQRYQEEVRQCQYCKHCKKSDDYPPECHYSNIGYFGVSHTGICDVFEKR